MLYLFMFFIGTPSLLGVAWALSTLYTDLPFPMIYERRKPWPNPFG